MGRGDRSGEAVVLTQAVFGQTQRRASTFPARAPAFRRLPPKASPQCLCLARLAVGGIGIGDEIDLQLVDWRPAYGQAARHRRRSADRMR
jgi:hypothetical protein